MRRLYVTLSVTALTLLSYFQFPGHTFLQSDTQIYMPILERFWDPSVLTNDIVATRPHVAFTIYDEMAIALRRVTGLDFEGVVTIQQLVFRALGIFGVYLIGTASGLSSALALLVGAIYGLGATVAGPAVLTVEYEPVPRGFAVPLVLFAIGLCAHGKMLSAAAVGAVATFYHPPTVYPFAIVFGLLALWNRNWRALLVFSLGAVALLIFSRVQQGLVEPQLFFSRIDPEIEKLQRLRGSYSFVSVWLGRFFWDFLILWTAGLLACWRIKEYVPHSLRAFLLGLPAIGVLSVPVSYVLLEGMRWTLMPQLQPTRALLWVMAIGVIAGAIAAMHAALKRRWIESGLWFLLVFAVSSHPLYLQVLWPDLSSPRIRTRVLVVLGLTLVAMLAMWLNSRWPRWLPAAIAIAAAAPFLAFPNIAKVENYAALHNADLDALAAWARSSTPKDAVFLFPDSGQELVPGIFRARSLRTIYVDWKGGGQVNFLNRFAGEWWSRWQAVMADKFEPSAIPRFKEAGIDYIVLKARNPLASHQPVFSNAKYLVYRIDSPR